MQTLEEKKKSHNLANKKYREKNKEKLKKYYENNKDKISEQNKKYCKKNEEKRQIYNKKYTEDNKEQIKQNKKQYRLNNLENIKIKKKIYYEKNKEEIKKYKKENKNKIAKTQKEYAKKNRKKLTQKTNDYYKKRKAIDPIFALSVKIRTSIGNSFRRHGFAKNKKTETILGCSFEYFKLYIECKFEPWMNWDNRGKYNGEPDYGWDIDHIIPLSTIKTEDDIIKLNHHTNLQPLCSYKNRDIKKTKLFYL